MNFNRFQQLAVALVATLENTRVPFYQYCLTFSAVIFIRYFLELFFLTDVKVFSLPPMLITMVYSQAPIHFLLTFLAVVLMASIGISLSLKVPISNVLRLSLASSLILILGPIIDISLARGEIVPMYYMMPGFNIDMIKAYFTMASNYPHVSVGQQIETIIILALCWTYCSVKGSHVVKCAAITLMVYTLIFMWGASPFFINLVLIIFGYTYQFSNMLMIRFFLIADLILVLTACYLANKKLFIALAKDMRATRILCYVLLLLLGSTLYLSSIHVSLYDYVHTHPDVVINELLSVISLMFAGMYCLIMNNIYDVEIDKISNTTRPLIAGLVDAESYQTLSYVFMICSLFYASMVGALAVVCVACMMGAYYLYSVPPVRFKRVTVLSKVAIGFNAYVVIMLGYMLMPKELYQFPTAVAWICFVGITLAANFIDLKDVEGDKACGIQTLPVLIGERAARQIIGAVFFLLAMSFYFVTRDYRSVPVLAAIGVLFYFAINRKNYKDRAVLLLCNASLLGYILYLVW